MRRARRAALLARAGADVRKLLKGNLKPTAMFGAGVHGFSTASIHKVRSAYKKALATTKHRSTTVDINLVAGVEDPAIFGSTE
eukprot:1979741-Prorocentrum_lima.AAC.1